MLDPTTHGERIDRKDKVVETKREASLADDYSRFIIATVSCHRIALMHQYKPLVVLDRSYPAPTRDPSKGDDLCATRNLRHDLPKSSRFRARRTSVARRYRSRLL